MATRCLQNVLAFQQAVGPCPSVEETTEKRLLRAISGRFSLDVEQARVTTGLGRDAFIALIDDMRARGVVVLYRGREGDLTLRLR